MGSVRRHLRRWCGMLALHKNIRELRWYLLTVRHAAHVLKRHRIKQRRTFINMGHKQRWAHRCACKIQAVTRVYLYRRKVLRRWHRVWELRSEIVEFMASNSQVQRWGVEELINTLNSPDLWPNPRLWWHRHIIFRIKLITSYARPEAVGSIRKLFLMVSSAG